jgi:hypothetical protein
MNEYELRRHLAMPNPITSSKNNTRQAQVQSSKFKVSNSLGIKIFMRSYLQQNLIKINNFENLSTT